MSDHPATTDTPTAHKPALRPISARLDAALVSRIRAAVRATDGRHTIASAMTDGFELFLARLDLEEAAARAETTQTT